MNQEFDQAYLRAIADLPDGWERIVRMFRSLSDERDTAQAIARAAIAQVEPLKRQRDDLQAANSREVFARRELKLEMQATIDELASHLERNRAHVVQFMDLQSVASIVAATTSAEQSGCSQSANSGAFDVAPARKAAPKPKNLAGSGAKVARPSQGSDALPQESAPVASSAGHGPSEGSNPSPANPYKARIPELPFDRRKAELERATAFLKAHGILVQVADRNAQIRKYRVSGKREAMMLEHVVAHAIELGMEPAE